MSEQQSEEVVVACPTTSNRDEWRVYWNAQGMPWRTEPEISGERQRYLGERRGIHPNVQQGIYPFKDVVLGSADLEWLLATHESGRGPVIWDDESQRKRQGLDLRGARLRQSYLDPDLQGLPLACTVGGLSLELLNTVPDPLRPQAIEAAAVHFEGIGAFRIDLRGAMLQGAYFTGVFIWDGHFECAFLLWARFQQCRLIGTHFEGVDCNLATFEQVQAPGAHFEGASIGSMRTAQVDFFESYFEGAGFGNARLQGARFVGARFHGAHLDHARLEGAVLDGAHLEGKELSAEELARLRAIKPNFPAVLPPADLRGAVLNSETSLVGSIVGDEKCGGVFLADARLSDTNLAVVDWTYTRNRLLRRRVEPIQLGDVREAHKATNQQDKPKSAEDWITGYMTAVRANRQLATALRSQGLNEDADNFAYEAQRLQREVLRRQRRYGAFLWSSLLDLISGYGYKPLRSVGTYLFIILFFMFVYSLFGVVDASCVVSGVASNGTLLATCSPAHTLTLREAFVFSLTSFHGRGFFPGGLGLGSPITLVAAAEAVIGLLIEITFIATFTQRFFAR